MSSLYTLYVSCVFPKQPPVLLSFKIIDYPLFPFPCSSVLSLLPFFFCHYIRLSLYSSIIIFIYRYIHLSFHSSVFISYNSILSHLQTMQKAQQTIHNRPLCLPNTVHRYLYSPNRRISSVSFPFKIPLTVAFLSPSLNGTAAFTYCLVCPII